MIARVAGKPKVVSQIYIGSPERVASLVTDLGDGAVKLKVEEYGAVWLAGQIDRDVDLVRIIDEVIPWCDLEEGPVREGVFSVLHLEPHVRVHQQEQTLSLALQQIRPVDIGELTSQKYWEKWHRITEEDLVKMSKRFFERIWALESPESDCLLFDTANYYIFMASDTPSALARRGKNKEKDVITYGRLAWGCWWRTALGYPCTIASIRATSMTVASLLR